MYPKRLSIDGGKEILMAVRRGLASRWRLHAGLVEITSKNTVLHHQLMPFKLASELGLHRIILLEKNYHFVLFKKTCRTTSV
jgi:hypothetical protein